VSKRKRSIVDIREFSETFVSKEKHSEKISRNKFYLSDNNRSVRVFKQIETGKVIEIVCVSLEILIDKKWKTITYYDNIHGYLHRHERVSLSDESETIVVLGVRQKGSTRRLLRWAIKDITINYASYKKRFLKRSNYTKLEIWENMY